MTRLEQQIRDALAKGDFVVSVHAARRLRERGILIWQVVEGSIQGRTLAVRASSRPNPSVLIVASLADGVECVCVWAWLKSARIVKLVTVYFQR